MTERTKRVLAITIPALLSLALIVTAVWGARRSSQADEYKTAAESMYKRAYQDLSAEFDKLSNTLSKLMVTGTKSQYIKTLDDIWRSSGACVSLMSQLPASHLDTVELNRFVVRLGDYAHSLSAKLLSGAMPTAEDNKQLSDLRDKCIELNQDLSDRLDSGDVPLELLDNDAYFTASDDSSQTDDNRQEFPTLIYDGPYSESAEKAEPKGLSGDEVDESRAREIALKLLPGNEQNTSLSAEVSDGNIPSFDFSGELSDGRFFEISITKKGGSVLWLMCSSTGDESGVPDDKTADEYKKAAQSYLRDAGFHNMVSTYAQYYGGAAVINFAASQDDVILYSDLVKVWVDRATHDVIGFDSRNYLYSHVTRDFEKPEITEEEAKASVSSNLNIESTELALIPITPNTEKLCYEFKGTFSGDAYIVYINAKTGEEEQIFKIIDTDDGSLVI